MERRHVLGVLTAAAGSAVFGTPLAEATEPAATPSDQSTERVSGIGGFFFRAHDPKALSQWYQDHLGITVVPQSAKDQPWTQQAGATAFQPFPEKTGYFGDPTKQWMINFRVGDLDKLVQQLGAAGIEVKVDATTYPNGRFAHLHDPEGNPLELWQPMKAGG